MLLFTKVIIVHEESVKTYVYNIRTIIFDSNYKFLVVIIIFVVIINTLLINIIN